MLSQQTRDALKLHIESEMQWMRQHYPHLITVMRALGLLVVLQGAKRQEIVFRLDSVLTMKLLAASWVGLINGGHKSGADGVEKAGKAIYGDEAFGEAMAATVDGSEVRAANVVAT
ncbi:hypothetical protein LTS10_010656 [Elasticomyces elasticus]|nr:hypothetical protein LTS10_010656 [Elasticomyces elasticus]